jgi:hypothetical protein
MLSFRNQLQEFIAQKQLIATKDNTAMYYVGFEDVTFPAEISR